MDNDQRGIVQQHQVFDSATILAEGTQKVGNKNVKSGVIWTNTYGKARVFNTTLGHNNATVEDPRYLRIVTRGLVWACNKPLDEYMKPEAKPLPIK